MGTKYEIPLRPSQPAIFSIGLDGTTYNFRLTFDIVQGGFWSLDIADANLNILLAGLPLVSGTDILAQYRHLGFAGALVITTDRGAGDVPGYDDLGVVAHLFYISDAA